MVLVLAFACSSEKPLCQPPPHTTYTCDPLPPGSPGCLGGPEWRSDYGPADAALQQDDPDKVFPRDCIARIPDCSPFYKGSPREYVCSSSGGWIEQI